MLSTNLSDRDLALVRAAARNLARAQRISVAKAEARLRAMLDTLDTPKPEPRKARAARAVTYLVQHTRNRRDVRATATLNHRDLRLQTKAVKQVEKRAQRKARRVALAA